MVFFIRKFIVILCVFFFSTGSTYVYAFSEGELKKLLNSSDDFDVEIALTYLAKNRTSFYNDEKNFEIAKNLIVKSNSIFVRSRAFDLLVLSSEGKERNFIVSTAKSLSEELETKGALTATKFYIQNASLTLDEKVELLEALKNITARKWLMNHLSSYLKDNLSIRRAFISLLATYQDSSTALAVSLLSQENIRDAEILEHLVTAVESPSLYANPNILEYIAQYGVDAYDYAPRLIQMYEDVNLKGAIYGDKATVLKSIEVTLVRIRPHSKNEYSSQDGKAIIAGDTVVLEK